MLEVRQGRAGDVAALAEIFWRGVREGAAPRYSAAQRAAWLPERPAPEAMARRLAGLTVFVAESGGAPSGFMSLRPDGYLDLAFVLPEARETGAAGLLLAMLENHAAAAGLRGLRARASDMARPFLLRHGWRAVGRRMHDRGGVAIPATDMIRDFAPARPLPRTG